MKGCFFKSYETNLKKLPDVTINLNIKDEAIPVNEIKTTKYGLIDFLPKNIFFQFTKTSNIYFLVSTAA